MAHQVLIVRYLQCLTKAHNLALPSQYLANCRAVA